MPLPRSSLCQYQMAGKIKENQTDGRSDMPQPGSPMGRRSDGAGARFARRAYSSSASRSRRSSANLVENQIPRNGKGGTQARLLADSLQNWRIRMVAEDCNAPNTPHLIIPFRFELAREVAA